MERNVELGLLLSYYGAFLTERQRSMLLQQVDEDLSLAEIAEREGISRQGVRDAQKRAEAQLRQMEARLGLLQKERATRSAARSLEETLAGIDMNEAQRARIRQTMDALQGVWEENDGV